MEESLSHYLTVRIETLRLETQALYKVIGMLSALYRSKNAELHQICGLESSLSGYDGCSEDFQISEFVHITGSLALEKGAVATVQVTEGLLPVEAITDILNLDLESIPANIPATGAESAELSFMTIGASNVNAFVGLEGPYWTDLDGDRQISWVLPDGTRMTDPDTSVTVDGARYGDLNLNGALVRKLHGI